MNIATMPEKKVHEGRNIKRIREMLGIKQETLAEELQISQSGVSLLEQKETIDQPMLESVAKVLKVPVEAIKNFTEDAAYNIIGNTVTNNQSVAFVQYYPTFNPIDKVVELYERLLQAEREKNEILQGKK